MSVYMLDMSVEKIFFDSDKGIPWWTTLGGDYTIISGHTITDNFHPHNNAYCLDGGISQGGKMRGLIINDSILQIVEVGIGEKHA